jgi:hypothetical protein
MVFYRRFTEAWVTTINIEEMLQLNNPQLLDANISPPKYPNKHNAFIPEIEFNPLRKIFDGIKVQPGAAELLASTLAQKGATHGKVRIAFSTFVIAGVVQAIIILIAFSGNG